MASAAKFRLKAPVIKEHELHSSVAHFLDWALPPPTVWTTFPAGWGKIGPATAGRLKHVGLKPGMPDIFIWYSKEGTSWFRCIGLELKVPGAYLSKQQQYMYGRLLKVGVIVYVCRSLEDVIARLKENDVPMRRLAVDSAA